MGKEEEQLSRLAVDQATMEEIKGSMSSDSMDKWKETTKPELFKFLAKPDYQSLKTRLEKYSYQPVELQDGTRAMQIIPKTTTISPFSKELKTSYLNKERNPVISILYVMELTDLAHQMNELGAAETSEFLFIFRDTLLSAAPSMDAMFLKLTQTEYSMKRMDLQSRKRRLLSRNEDQSS